MRRTFLAIHCFVFFLAAAAQNNMQQQFIFQHINEKSGLSHNIINAILKDQHGFMWIATFDGLNRFDGTHFITFRHDRNRANGLHHNSVQDICLDKNGDIWCANQTAISCFRQKTQTFETFFPETKKPNTLYSDVVCDAWGNIWCASNHGLYKYVSQTRSFINYNTDGPADLSLSSNFIHKKGLVLSPDKKSLWIATTKGMNYFDIANNVICNYKNNPSRLAVFDSEDHYPACMDLKGRLLYGCADPDRLRRFNFTTGIVEDLDILYSKQKNSAGTAASIFIDRNNRYWISTWGYSTFLYDPDTRQVQEFYQDKNSPFSVGGDFFWHAYQDEEGTIWLGTVNGLSYTNPDITLYRLHEPMKNAGPEMQFNSINRYFEDNNGIWWFTCYDKYDMRRYDPATGEMQSFTLPQPGTGIISFTQYKHHVWLSTSDGLFSANALTAQPEESAVFAKLKKMIGKQAVYWLRTIGDSLVCLQGEKSGIIQYNLNTQSVKSISPEQDGFLKRNRDHVKACIISSKGDLYLLFTPLKIARYNLEQNRLDSLPVLVDKNIQLIEGPSMGMKEDKDGNLWMAVKETGLIFYDVKKKQTKVWQQSEGLVFNQVFDAMIDSYGKIWLAAYNKFSVYDPLNNKFENFTLPVSENYYNYGSRLLKLSNGNILGNIDKTFIEWFPDKIEKNYTIQTVLINRLVLQDSSVWLPQKEIKLKHNENDFSIEFGILTGLEKNRYRIEYKLEGFNEEWVEAGPANTAVYTNVPEKDLVFRVRAVSPDRSKVGKEIALAIRVIPPFYRTIWFRIIAALLLASLIAWIIRQRINNIRKVEKQKNEFNKVITEWRLKALRSQMNPHFVFNCMNSIDMYILKNDVENASRYLNKFARLVRLILNQSDEMYVPLAKEIEMLKYYIELEKLRFDHPFSHSIQVDESIDIEETEIPSMLLQPYIENAILHGLRHKKENGHLSIIIRRRNEGLFCIIEDDGIGREKAVEINSAFPSKHHSKGTILTAERLSVLDNNQNKPVINAIDLKDEHGEARGTRVEITIPVEFDY